MAERTKFSAYCIYSGVISLFIYPIEAHWIWGGGWLSQLGFHDFAGSCAIHMVGGGTKDGFLCQMTADATGVPVIAGPIEATAAGNIAVQLISAGEIKDLAEARAIIADSFSVVEYKPQDSGFFENYEKFCKIVK